MFSQINQLPPDEEADEEISWLKEEHGLDEDVAEQARDLMEEEGLDEDEAVEIAEEL